GRRTVVLFGPSDDRKWSRADDQHAVVRNPLPCSPCSIFGYHKYCRDIPCMRSISVEQVMQVVDAQNLSSE
ncbi:MAG: glycosyltransferase family 9 protein, partial [Verrucomicrobia bacterium]|nr:glycosyltransferase family 9 protein [Verrucomicrobiota bacterium]